MGKTSTREGAAVGATGATGGVAVIETPAGAAGTVHDEVRAADGARIAVEGTSGAAAAAAEALAAGGAGAGVGGHRIAEALDGPAVRDVPIGGADHIGDRTGTFPRPEVDRRDRFGSYLDDVAAGRRTGAHDGFGVAASTTRPGRNAILPLAQPKLDPRLVPGVKVATAAAQILQGKGHAPGEPVRVDFKTYTELTAVGAITAVPWHDLPDHDPD